MYIKNGLSLVLITNKNGVECIEYETRKYCETGEKFLVIFMHHHGLCKNCKRLKRLGEEGKMEMMKEIAKYKTLL